MILEVFQQYTAEYALCKKNSELAFEFQRGNPEGSREPFFAKIPLEIEFLFHKNASSLLITCLA